MITGFRSKAQFYSTAGLLNLAVGAMFYIVNIAPIPVLATPPPPLPAATPKDIPATVGIPTKISVPSVNIQLPVKVGSYHPEDGSWDLDLTSAYYADASMPVNNANGATIIYGHAQATIFETLPQVQPGAEAYVQTDNGYSFVYQYLSSREVPPTDVSVFTASGPPTLVLQTCIGPYSELRGLYSFKLVRIEKI
jgi:LPXTG-site transpeptidase (sortase) family protein